jgi:hypothetical protein
MVNVDTLGKIIAGVDNSLCLGDTLQLTVSGGKGPYLWTPNLGLNDPNIPNPKAFPTKTTDYIVRGAASACPIQDTIRITVCVCSVFDTIVVYDTIPVYDSIAVNIYDTLIVQHHIYDTINVSVYDSIAIHVFDTLIVHHNVYDTIQVIDTVWVYHHSYDTIRVSVTDTLFIDVLTGLPNPGSILNTIKVYPNPAHDVVLIDNGNYASMSTYSLKIINALGQSVFSNAITQQQLTVSTATLGGAGVYFIQILDASNHLVESKKLIIR